MSVNSNDGGGGGGKSARPAVMLQISLLSVFFWYCMEVPDTNLGGIVQSVTPSMPGKLNSTCVLVLLFIIKLHFLNTTIVSVMYSVEYTYQGFIHTLSQYNDCFCHVQCGVYIPGVHTVGG